MKSGSLWAHCLGQILVAATVWEAAEISFFAANNARFRRFPIGNISLNLSTTTSISESVKTFGTEFWKFYRKGSFFSKNRNAKIANKISRSNTPNNCESDWSMQRHTTGTDAWLQASDESIIGLELCDAIAHRGRSLISTIAWLNICDKYNNL